jgi:hypothetical protein
MMASNDLLDPFGDPTPAKKAFQGTGGGKAGRPNPRAAQGAGYKPDPASSKRRKLSAGSGGVAKYPTPETDAATGPPPAQSREESGPEEPMAMD